MKQVREILEFSTAPPPIRKEIKERGYMARELVQCTLPHKNPGDEVEAFTRQDGNISLGIRSGYDYKLQKRVGLPYGSIPRLLLLWMTSEAVRTGNHRLDLGNTLSQFLRDVGLDPATGRGKRGDAKRLKEQMLRLFMAEITFQYTEGTQVAGGTAWMGMKVAPEGALWWDFKQPENATLFQSYIILGETFFKAITANPVPVNLVIAGRLKRSPMALDLFIWSTYRLHRMDPNESITVSYPDLQRQFGSEYGRGRNFKAALKDALEKVCGEWPALNYDLTNRGLILHGVMRDALPVSDKKDLKMLGSRVPRDCFDLSGADLMKAAAYCKGLDVRVMRDEWRNWCKSEKITPEKPLGHFISFLKTHKKRNG